MPAVVGRAVAAVAFDVALGVLGIALTGDGGGLAAKEGTQ
jgi:hypothetical protein